MWFFFKKLTVLGGTFVGLSGCLLSLPAWSLDMTQAYQMALEKDPSFLANQAYLRSLDSLSDQALQAVLPTISVAAIRDSNQKTEVSNSGTSYRSATNYSATLTQSLFDYSSLKGYQKIQTSLKKKDILDQQYRAALMSKVLSAYTDVLIAKESVEASSLQKQLAQRQAELSEQQFEQGLLSEIERQESEIKAKQSHAAWLAAQHTFILKQQAFRQIVGVPLESFSSVDLNLPSAIENNDAALENNVMEAPEVKLANFDYEAAVLESEKQQAKHLPTLSFSANWKKGPYDVTGGTTSASSNRTYSLQLSVPIFSGFSVTSKAAEVRELEQKALFELEDQKAKTQLKQQELSLGLETDFLQAQQAINFFKNKQMQQTYQETALELGTRTDIDVLYAKIQAQNAYVDALKAKVNLEKKWLELRSLLGKETEKTMTEMANRLFGKS
jgi:outer membrane protein TolC